MTTPDLTADTEERKTIDLRSDTVTRPGAAMRQAMAEAAVGDDVYRDDPTVLELEARVAGMLGFAAALFTTSGTQANLVGIMSHCARGDEYIVGQTAHTYRYEAGGAAVLGSIQPQPIEFEADSTLDLDKVAAKIKPDDIHFARTRLLCLEDTQNGRPLPLPYLAQAAAFAREKNLRIHLDGARLFNAAVSQKVAAREISHHFDSVAVCLSKGLGAPVGSLLCGSDELIEQARRWRKMVGGGLRQAGILAAAGLYALDHNIERLADDHDNAARLAAGLRRFPELSIPEGAQQTNMVFVHTSEATIAALTTFLEARGIIIRGGATTRLVTHLDVNADDIDRVLAACTAFFQG